MLATLFLLIGILFGVMVWRAAASGEIMGRGWGFSTRIYSRDGEPVWYWVTFVSYLVISIWTLGFAAMAAFGVAF